MAKLKVFAVFITIGFLCFIAYYNSLDVPFIWDDIGLIVKNPFIQDWHNFSKVFSRDLYSGTVTGSNFYRPLQTLSIIWDYHFWQLNPLGYHITNILLQVLASFLVFLFLRSIIAGFSIPFLSAALFSISPLNTEVVTYISGRAEMLMGIFLLSSIILFMRARYRCFRFKPIYLSLSVFAFILALLSKELSLVFPLVIIAYLFYFRVPGDKKQVSIIKPALPYIAAALIYLLLRSTLLHFPTLNPPALTQYPILLRLSVLPRVVFTYFRLLFLPINLHMSWTIIRPSSFLGFFFSWFALVAICVGCWYLLFVKRGSRVFRFLLFWAVIFIIPQLGIIPINAFIAEHFIYLSSISFFVALAYLLKRYLRRDIFIFSSAALFLFYGLLTFSRNAEWQDPVVFYEKNIKYSPDSFQSHNNLGTEYEYRHLMYQKAEFEYKKALEIKPDLIEARSNLANIYFKTGRLSDAKREYELIKKSAPPTKLGEIENNIGCIYELEGDWDKALGSYRQALKLDPNLNFTRFNIAKIYFARGKLKESAKELLSSLPEIGSSLEKKENHLLIINKYLKAVKLTTAVKLYNDLGVEFASQGLFQDAVFSFKRALEVEPAYSDAYFNLGLAYWNLGSRKEAIFAMKRALKINPNHLRAKGFLKEIIYRK
jgi:tetratricopeptide (TPR) repeat protein